MPKGEKGKNIKCSCGRYLYIFTFGVGGELFGDLLCKKCGAWKPRRKKKDEGNYTGNDPLDKEHVEKEERME